MLSLLARCALMPAVRAASRSTSRQSNSGKIVPSQGNLESMAFRARSVMACEGVPKHVPLDGAVETCLSAGARQHPFDHVPGQESSPSSWQNGARASGTNKAATLGVI